MKYLSADELIHQKNINNYQYVWLFNFIKEWENATYDDNLIDELIVKYEQWIIENNLIIKG